MNAMKFHLFLALVYLIPAWSFAQPGFDPTPVPYTTYLLSCGSGITRSIYQEPKVFEISQATGYEYRIYTDASLETLYATYTGTSNEKFVLNSVSPTLQWGTTYYVTVAVVIGSNTGAHGSACTLEIIADPAGGVDAPNLSNYNNSFKMLSDNMYSSLVDGADQYDFEAYTSDGVTLVGSYTPSGTSTRKFTMGDISGVAANTTYKVKVRANIGSYSSALGTAATIKVLPTSFSGTTLNSQFCDKSVSQTQYIYATPVSGANYYTYALYSDADCLNFMDSVKVMRYYMRLSDDFPSLSTGTYYVKVRPSRLHSGSTYIDGAFGSACSITYTAFSSVGSTRLNAAFRGSTQSISNTVTNAIVSGATQYTYAFYTDAACTDLADSISVNNTNSLKLSAAGLSLANGTYYVKVRASINTLEGSYSTADALTITGAGSRQGKGNLGEGHMLVYPNPSEGLFTVSYKAYAEEEAVEMIVYRNDVEVSRFALLGSFEQSMDLSQYPSGLYLIRILGPNSTATQKIAIK